MVCIEAWCSALLNEGGPEGVPDQKRVVFTVPDIYTQEDNRQRGKDTNTVGDTTQSPMTQETMTELVECNTTSTRL